MQITCLWLPGDRVEGKAVLREAGGSCHLLWGWGRPLTEDSRDDDGRQAQQCCDDGDPHLFEGLQGSAGFAQRGDICEMERACSQHLKTAPAKAHSLPARELWCPVTDALRTVLLSPGVLFLQTGLSFSGTWSLYLLHLPRLIHLSPVPFK